jgi:hypothetical protein
MFVGKARAYPREAPFRVGHTHQHLITRVGVQMLMDKVMARRVASLKLFVA